MRLPVMPPVAPMLAKPVAGIPPGQLYEPKWDGFRAIVFRDGDAVEIGSRNERPMSRYFPEVVRRDPRERAAALRARRRDRRRGADGRTLDFWALQQRLHPAASRVALLADAHAGRVRRLRPARARRRGPDAPPVPASAAPRWRRRSRAPRRPSTSRRSRATRPSRGTWFERFEGAGLDGVIAKDPEHPYQPGKRVMAKVKHVRTADCVLAGYRVHKSGPDAIGSLLLGLHDDGDTPAARWADMFGGLMSVGVVGAFPMARRRELFAELQPLVCDLAEHPWRRIAGAAEAHARGHEGSRWNPGKDLSFVPLRPERVLEVRYDHMEGTRFRHPPQFVRWRPDRDPASCGYAQLERPVRFALDDVLAGRA